MILHLMSFKLNFLEFNLNLAKQLLKNVKRDPGNQSRFTCTFLVYIIEEPIYPYFFILFFFSSLVLTLAMLSVLVPSLKFLFLLTLLLCICLLLVALYPCGKQWESGLCRCLQPRSSHIVLVSHTPATSASSELLGLSKPYLPSGSWLLLFLLQILFCQFVTSLDSSPSRFSLHAAFSDRLFCTPVSQMFSWWSL